MAFDQNKRCSMANCWSDLPQDVLVFIANLLLMVEDFLAFGLVCKTWRLAAAKENYTGGLTYQVPLLLSYRRVTNTLSNTVGEFFNLRNGKTHKFSLARFELYSSALGWLIVKSEDFGVGLLHPFNQHPMVKLPNMKMSKNNGKEYRVFWNKFALSSSPSSTSDYVVMAIYNLNRLAFCRPGDDEWTLVDEEHEQRRDYHDVTYYKGHFYVVDFSGQVSVCHTEDPKRAWSRLIGNRIPGGHQDYRLVESRGVLLAIQIKREHFKGLELRVFEVPCDDGNWLDSEVTDLENRTLFLGKSSSVSVEASTYPRCKTNCIYMAIRFFLSARRYVYSMVDKEMETYMDDNDYSIGTQYLWVQPSF